MRRRWNVVLLVSFVPVALGAQTRNDHWFFGIYAGLDFSGGDPVYQPQSALNAFEGMSSISDLQGDLLFYTDGDIVYDRQHEPMPNGFGLGADASSSQSCVIVPIPGDSMRYYVFAVPAQVGYVGSYSGLSWSIVDMAENNGYGAVTLKYQHLVDSVTEQISALYHANGNDVWVVCRKFRSDEWYAYPVTCDGIGPPVVSATGLVLEDTNPIDTQACLGQMSFNTAGTKVASTWNDYSGGTTFLEVLDFDAATGQVSNSTSLQHPSPFGSNTGYGLAFSASGNRLYWSEFNGNITQFDMLAPDILASEQVVAVEPQIPAAMRLGPDGRIYVSRFNSSTPYIARIEFPELLGGASNYVSQAVSLGPNAVNTSAGLPNHWAIDARKTMEIFAWEDTLICTADTLLLQVDGSAFGDPNGYTWNTGETTSDIEVVAPGTYVVGLLYDCYTLWDTLQVTVLGTEVDLGEDVVLCNEEQQVVLGDAEAEGQHLWSTGSTEPTITVEGSGTYWLIRTDEHGCAATDSVVVSAEFRSLDLGPDVEVCAGERTFIAAPEISGTRLWSTGSNADVLEISAVGEVWLRVLDTSGCVLTDTVRVSLGECFCDVHLPNAFSPDGDGLNEVFEVRSTCAFADFSLSIHDRWGKEIWQTQSPSGQWSGDVPLGVYNYMLSYTYKGAGASRTVQRMGSVTVVR
jgi:gliding motility-associated-like protein